MNQPQEAELQVALTGIVIKVGGQEISLTKLAAQQLLQALPALLKAYDELQKVNSKP